MPNEQEISVKIKVPVGDACYRREGYFVRVHCSVLNFNDRTCGCCGSRPLENIFDSKTGSFLIEKCDPCKAECEKAKEVCGTCGGSGKVDSNNKIGKIGSGLGFLLDCLDCKQKE